MINAGVHYCEPYDAIPGSHRREILAANLEAPVALMQAVARQRMARKSGRIVSVGSVAAFTGVMRTVHSGRVCLPEEVAATILWLGSASPEYVSGTTLDINNGSYPG